jgi:cytochrome c553
MKPLFQSARQTSHRLPRLARPTLGVLLLASAFGAAAQQWTRGQTVWNSSSVLCGSCHIDGNLSLSAMQGRYLTVAAARAAADTGASRSSGMNVIWSSLSNAQKDDVSAYVANFRAEGAAFISTGGPTLTVASTGQTAQATVRLQNNGKALLRVNMSGGQTVTGDTAQFLPVMGVGSGCDAQSINPGAFCEVTVTYRPQVVPASQHSLTVTFTHNGEPTTTSAVTITGRISAAPAPAPAPTPAPAPAPSSDGGGGALPLALWAMLLPAALVARRRRD